MGYCLLIAWYGANKSVYSKASAGYNFYNQESAISQSQVADTIEIDRFIGLIREQRFSNPELAQTYADSALSIAQAIEDKPREAEILNQLGIIASVLGDTPGALEYFLDVLRVREEIGDVPGIARIQNNLGILYKNLENYELSLEFHSKSLSNKRILNDSLGIARSLNNIGEIYHHQRNANQAERHFQEALQYMLDLSFKEGLAAVYNNLGELYKLNGDINRAIEFHSLSLEIEKELDNKPGIGLSYLNIGSLFQTIGQTEVAIENYLQSVRYFKEVNDLGGLRKAYKDLGATYAELENFKESLSYFQLHSQIKDTLSSIETNQRIAELQTEYESEKQKQEIKLLNETSALQLAKLDQEKSTRRLLFVIVFLLILIVIILYVSDRSKRRINEELISKNKEIEEAAALKVQFLSVMSHEIRTPMNAVVGMTNLLVNENPREDQKEYLETLSFSSTNLLSIVNDVLDYSKAEANKIELEIIDLRLLHLLTNIHHSFYNQSVKKGVYLKFEHDKKIPEVIKGDPTRLTQIINNLVSNALKFTDEGAITVKADLQDQSDDHVIIRFEVTDTGTGIPANKIDTIFESFTQANTETHRKYGGTGLGLTITKKLLELYNSEIKVVSTVGKGTTFSFSIRFPIGDLNETLKESASDIDSLESLKNVNLLLVEDNPTNVQIIQLFLKKWDINPVLAENGSEALRKVAEQDFDIILMDLHMPIMDGYEATKTIRLTNKTMPIVALTASNVFEEHTQAYDAGVNAIVPKPFNPNELHNTISKLTSEMRN